MRLEIGNFYVKDVCFGHKNSYEQGILTINKEEALKLIFEDDKIIEADIIIAKPGESKRIVPIKEAIEARVRLDGRSVFPGVTGPVKSAGSGKLHALKNMSILAVGKHWGSFGDGIVDMSGEGANYSYYSKLINICLVAETNEEFERHEQQKKITL